MFWYLATPYSKYPAHRWWRHWWKWWFWGRGWARRMSLEEAFQEASRQSAILVSTGIPVLSPIAHTHPIALYGGIDPLDYRIWLPADKPFMDAASGLIVCMLEGWETSVGVMHEIDAFEKARKPIIYMTPGTIPEITLNPSEAPE